MMRMDIVRIPGSRIVEISRVAFATPDVDFLCFGESLLLEHKLYSETSYGLSWSPDGRSIAFETGELNCTVVATAQIATGNERRMTSCTGPFRASVAPSWQPQAAQKD